MIGKRYRICVDFHEAAFGSFCWGDSRQTIEVMADMLARQFERDFYMLNQEAHRRDVDLERERSERFYRNVLIP
jgi:hypothetical protein